MAQGSTKNEESIKVSDVCGCYYCKSTFDKSEVLSPDRDEDWIEDGGEGNPRTAQCPRCGIDSVVTMPPYNLPADLEELNRKWFGSG